MLPVVLPPSHDSASNTWYYRTTYAGRCTTAGIPNLDMSGTCVSRSSDKVNSNNCTSRLVFVGIRCAGRRPDCAIRTISLIAEISAETRIEE